MPRFLYLSTLALTGVVYALNGSVADYAPLVNQPCPNVTTDPLLRVFTPKNQSLHPLEEEYVDTRLTTVIPEAWNDWIGNGSAIGYNLSEFVTTSASGGSGGGGNGTNGGAGANATGNFPKIGLAVSGGGYRAAQYGAGVLSALDARNDSAKAAGTGGFLQVTSYLSGLSGTSHFLFFFFFIPKKTKKNGGGGIIYFFAPLCACNVLLACFIDVPFATGLQEAHGSLARFI